MATAAEYRKLCELFEHRMTDGPEAREIHPDSPEGKTRGEVEAAKELTDLFRSRVIDPKNIDVGRLFEQCFGSHEYFSHRRNRSMPYDLLYRRPLLEAQGAVSSASFLNITGQIVYGSVLDKYEVPEFAFSKMIPERPAITLRGEKIAGVTNIGDEIMERGEGKPYALAGVSEDWIETPQIVDRGLEVDLTWEAVFEDKTGQLLDQAGGVGRSMGINKEKRAIDAVVDENTTRHRYRWRGTTIATYGDNSGSHSWDNLAASNGLVDWTDLDNVEQVRNGITDPYTGEPVEWELTDLIVTKQNEKTAERILRATEIRVATPGYATSANPTLTNVANPYTNKYQLVSSLWLATRMATDTDWFVGNVAKAVACMMAQKMEVRQAAAGNPDELKRRIVSQFYVNEMSEFVVVQPRLLLKSTA